MLRHLFLDESDGVKSWLHEQHPVTTSTARRLIAKDFLSGDPQRELEARSSSKKPKITIDKDNGVEFSRGNKRERVWQCPR